MAEAGYWGLVAAAAAIAFLLCYALAFYAIRGILERVRAHRDRNTIWMPATRQVGTQTWVVVQLVHHNTFGERILAEQLIDVIKATDPFHDLRVTRKGRVAELRAAWLNHGEPETPTM